MACGIDLGSLRTPAYVAWLTGQRFRLDMYMPSAERPLPSLGRGAQPAAYFGIDAPQGLPARGSSIREADCAAGTPTKKLPADRDELARSKLYRGLIEAGIDVFWSVHERRLGHIPGLEGGAGWPVVFETYPRYVIRQLWPGLSIPSKRREPRSYVDAVWGRITSLGYHCHGVIRPTVDQVDAMLCALAAGACLEEGGWRGMAIGSQPVVDEEARVLREGYIVSPARKD